MSEKYKIPDNIGTIIKGKLPEIKEDYDLIGNKVYSIVDKAIISMQENIDDKLCEHIRQVAMDNGIDTVYVMDKKFIAEAIKRYSPMLVDRYTHENQLDEQCRYIEEITRKDAWREFAERLKNYIKERKIKYIGIGTIDKIKEEMFSCEGWE